MEAIPEKTPEQLEQAELRRLELERFNQLSVEQRWYEIHDYGKVAIGRGQVIMEEVDDFGNHMIRYHTPEHSDSSAVAA